jgi:hypothetical protein
VSPTVESLWRKISLTKKKQGRGMEGAERDMVTKLGGLENSLAKELATSQSREAIGCDIDGWCQL